MSLCAVIFGLGFTGCATARLLAAAGWEVHGTARTAERAKELTAELGSAIAGVHVFSGGDSGAAAIAPEGLRAALSKATHILSTAQPAKGAEGAAAGELDPVLPTLLGLLRSGSLAGVRWVGYLSTTGVYGDRKGVWVDEADLPQPRSPRAKRRVAAEAAWLSSGLPAHVLRLPGIYGPGRGPLAKVRDGKARIIAKRGQYFSRVHASDVAGAVLASAIRPTADPSRPFGGDLSIFNVADDAPGPQGPVTALACRLLGEPVPEPVAFDDVAGSMSPMARSFFTESRRVSSRRVRDVLGFLPAFPSFGEGLPACVQEEAELESGRTALLGGVAFTPTAALAAAHHISALGLSAVGPARAPAQGSALAWPESSVRLGPSSLATAVELIGPTPALVALRETITAPAGSTPGAAPRSGVPAPDKLLAAVSGPRAAAVAVARATSCRSATMLATDDMARVSGEGDATPVVAVSEEASLVRLAGPGPRPWGSDPFAEEDAAKVGDHSLLYVLGVAGAALGRAFVAALGCTPVPRPRGGLLGRIEDVPWFAGGGITAIVVDNGSIQPGATLALRRICRALWDRYGVRAVPASARYSDRIDAAELNGRPAELLHHALVRTWQASAGRRIVVLPLFFGPSATIAMHLPLEVDKAAKEASTVRGVEPGQVVIVPPLCMPDIAATKPAPMGRAAALLTKAAASPEGAAWLDPASKECIVPSLVAPRLSHPERASEVAAVGFARSDAPAIATPTGPRVQISGLDSVALALADRVLEALARDYEASGAPPTAAPLRILLCEHGSPSKDVHAVREAVAPRLAAALATRGVNVASVRGCAMERKPGDAYAFSEPMLARALPDAVADASASAEAGAGEGVRVVLALMFLLPGKHAGVGGDVAKIAASALDLAVASPAGRSDDAHRAALRTRGVLVADVLGEHPAVLDVLWNRLRWGAAHFDDA